MSKKLSLWFMNYPEHFSGYTHVEITHLDTDIYEWCEGGLKIHFFFGFWMAPKSIVKAIGNPRKKQGLKVFDNFETSIDRIWPEEIQMRVLTAAMDS